MQIFAIPLKQFITFVLCNLQICMAGTVLNIQTVGHHYGNNLLGRRPRTVGTVYITVGIGSADGDRRRLVVGTSGVGVRAGTVGTVSLFFFRTGGKQRRFELEKTREAAAAVPTVSPTLPFGTAMGLCRR
jgi:hypothetical protein